MREAPTYTSSIAAPTASGRSILRSASAAPAPPSSDVASARREQPSDRPDRRRLSTPVRTDQRDALSSRDAARQVGESDKSPEPDGLKRHSAPDQTPPAGGYR